MIDLRDINCDAASPVSAVLMQVASSVLVGGELSVNASWSHANRSAHTLTRIPQRFSQ